MFRSSNTDYAAMDKATVMCFDVPTQSGVWLVKESSPPEWCPYVLEHTVSEQTC